MSFILFLFEHFILWTLLPLCTSEFSQSILILFEISKRGAWGPVRPHQMHRSKDSSVYRHSEWETAVWLTDRPRHCPSETAAVHRPEYAWWDPHLSIKTSIQSTTSSTLLAHAPSTYLSTKYAKIKTSTGEDRGQRVTWGREVFVPVAVVIDGVLLIGTEGNVYTQMSAALSSLEPRGEHRPHLHRWVGQHIWPITVRNAPPLKTTAEDQAQRFSLIRSLILSCSDSDSFILEETIHTLSDSYINSCTHKQTLETDSIILTHWAIHWLFDSRTLT